MAKKSKFGTVVATALATILLLGTAGVITTGVLSDGFKNWDTSTWLDKTFDGIEIEDQVKVHTGSKLEPTVKLPDGFTSEVKEIKKDGISIDLETGAVDVGEYEFTIIVRNVPVGEEKEKSKEYLVKLTITEDTASQTIVNQGGMNLRLLKSETRANGEVVKTFTYTITPATATNQEVNVAVAFADNSSSTTDDDAWKSGKTIEDYVTIANDSATKTITLTNKQAFGSQVIATITSIDNPEAKATVKVEYRKKRTYSISTSGNTIEISKSWSDYAKGEYIESVGTLANQDETYTASLVSATINTQVNAVVSKYTAVSNALKTGRNSDVSTAVRALSGKDYNDVVKILNSHKEDAVTFTLKYATVSNYTFTAGYNLNLNADKVENIEVSDSVIEF